MRSGQKRGARSSPYSRRRDRARRDFRASWPRGAVLRGELGSNFSLRTAEINSNVPERTIRSNNRAKITGGSMAASGDRSPRIGVGALRTGGGWDGGARRRSSAEVVCGFNTASLESRFAFARRRRSVDDPGEIGIARSLPNTSARTSDSDFPRRRPGASLTSIRRLAWNSLELWSR